MSDRGGSARQRELLEVRDPAVAGEIADEDLTAPQPAVVTVAEAVHADADDGVLPAVLDQPRRDVRVVVLHGHLLLLRQRQRVLGRQVLRVEVVGDHLGLEPEEAPVDRDAGLVVLQRLQVLEIADVLAEEGVGVARQAEGVLELGAGRQRLRERPRQGHRERGVAPGPADQPRPAAAHLRDGVVVAHGDLPVVHQVGVGDRREPVDLLPALDDRLLRQVAAGHHQRPAGGLQEQHVERRVRQHRAEVALADGDLRVHRVAVSPARLRAGLAGRADRAPLEQHDRVFRRREQVRLFGADATVRAKLLEAGEHDGERLVGAPLALLQAAHGVAIRGVAGEMEAAETFDGQDLAGAQQNRGLTDGRRRAGFAAGGQLDHAAPLMIRHAAAAREGRTPDTRWAPRGSGGRPGPRTPAGRPGTAGSSASSSARGRRAGPR